MQKCQLKYGKQTSQNELNKRTRKNQHTSKKNLKHDRNNNERPNCENSNNSDNNNIFGAIGKLLNTILKLIETITYFLALIEMAINRLIYFL